MKYICMGFHNEQTWAALSPSVRQALVEESCDYEDELRRAGHVKQAIALQPAEHAATVRFARGKLSVTDGPFAETKEQLGGFMLLEANDLNHAIQIVSQLPCMRVDGCIEIRPINEDLRSS